MANEQAPNMTEKIRVKLLGKFQPGKDGFGWTKFFPDNTLVWKNCQFTFDRNCRDYDWLVVYDDLPSLAGERHTLWEEDLACAPEHTLLMTCEPSTIKIYGDDFLRQFRWVLTTQEEWATGRHPGRLYEQPAMVWLYSYSSPRGDWSTIANHVPVKTRDISTVCSSKKQGNTLHRRRYEFTMALRERMPDLDVFGRGIRPVEDKADALDPYRYHIAIENFAGEHHWTEKLADPFLGACMPLYYGCPNVADYFPPESFLYINIWDLDEAQAQIERAIRDRLYEKNLSAVLESRRLVLEQYGPIPTICRLVNERQAQPASAVNPAVNRVISRRRMNRKLLPGASYLASRIGAKIRHGLARNH
jgi:hypothetical protein